MKTDMQMDIDMEMNMDIDMRVKSVCIGAFGPRVKPINKFLEVSNVTHTEVVVASE